MLFGFLVNASYIMLHILLIEILHVVLDKLLHVFLLVVGLLAQPLVGKHSQTAVALQGTGRNLKQKTEILVVKQFLVDARASLVLSASLMSQHQHVIDAVNLLVQVMQI